MSCSPWGCKELDMPELLNDNTHTHTHTHTHTDLQYYGFPGGSDGKEPACDVGGLDSISGLGRSHGGGLGNPLQYSCLENRRGQRSLASYSTANGVAKFRHD